MVGVIFMKLCATTDYAIQIMIEVARSHEIISSSVLSERTGISQKYLKKITTRLKEAGLLNSVPGHYGGYTLPCEPEQLSLWDIFAAIEPNKPLVALQKHESGTGSRSIVKKLYSEMNGMLQMHFRSVSLADLAKMSGEKDVIDI